MFPLPEESVISITKTSDFSLRRGKPFCLPGQEEAALR